MSDEAHVMPSSEQDEHLIRRMCWCDPEITVWPDGGILVFHQAKEVIEVRR